MSKTLLTILLLALTSVTAAQNTPPTLDFIADGNSIFEGDTISVLEGDTTNWIMTAMDIDGDPLSISFSADLEAAYNGYVTFFDSGNGTATFSLSPLYYENGLFANITLSAFDGVDSTHLLFNLNVVDVQVPPVWDPIADAAGNENEELTFDVTASDADNRPGAAPNHFPIARMVNAPEGAFLSSISDGRWSFSWTPDYTQSGAYDIIFLALDDEDSTTMVDTQFVHIDIAEAGNQPPVFGVIADSVRIIERTPIVDTITASDPEGGIVELSATNLPAGATFADSLNNTAIFSWTPDETQYPIVYTITFGATDDSLTTITKDKIIFVDGPNQPVNLIVSGVSGGNVSVTEGDSLGLSMIANDPDEMQVAITIEGMPPGDAGFEDRGNNTAFFYFKPTYLQSGLYPVTFIADDGAIPDTEAVFITVVEAGNQSPFFNPIDLPLIVKEGESRTDTLTASDLDRLPGDTLFLTMLDEFSFLSFTQISDSSGELTMTPDLTQGGTYDIRFSVSDSAAGDFPGTFAVDTAVISIDVLQSNFPPVLNTIDDQTVDEGRYLRFPVIVSDADTIGPEPRLSVISDPDDSLDSSFYTFVDYGDSTGLFELYADFSIVDTSATSRSLRFTFIAADDVEADSQDVIVTVFNSAKDANDPGRADTLLVENVLWDGRSDGFSITTRIWNDSALVAAGTGFSWDIPWIDCDSIAVHIPLRESGDYVGTNLVNDSSQIYVGFIKFDSTYLDSGYHDYFTAYFSIDSSLSADTTFDIAEYWESGDMASILKATVGHTGGFAFDKRLRGPMTQKAIDNLFSLNAESEYTYVPLVNDGLVRAVFNMANISLYDVADDKLLRAGDTLYIDGTNRAYQLLISLENPQTVTGLNLGFVISSPDGAAWSYEAQTGGLGAGTQAVTVIDSRMTPHTDIWDASGGLQVTEVNVDGLSADSVIFSASASSADVAGLPAGLAEDMIALNFIPGGVGSGEVKTICIDTGLIDGMSGWGLSETNLMSTKTNGSLCYPIVVLNPTGTDDDSQLPVTYSLGQNYPNPFNPTTTIQFSIGRRGHVSVTVYNIVGQVVRVLIDGEYEAGTHEIVWDGRDRDGRASASGIYLYRLESEELTKTKKMILLK